MKYTIEFKKGDLYYAIQHADFVVNGKYNKGYWNLSISLIDTYDFTDFRTLADGAFLGVTANNLGWAMQKIGMLIPFHIGLEFNYKTKMKV